MTSVPCLEDDCDRSGSHARGYCHRHYVYHLRRGDFAHLQHHRSRDVDFRAFFASLLRPDMDHPECMIWTGDFRPNGYGRVWLEGRDRSAHQVAWELVNGPIPDGLQVRHYVCNNPPCCNIDHLRIGTQADNMMDKVDAGRQARGERHGRSKLTEDDVRSIRLAGAQGYTQMEIAAMFGVKQPQVSSVLRREAWTHVE